MLSTELPTDDAFSSSSPENDRGEFEYERAAAIFAGLLSFGDWRIASLGKCGN